MKAIEILMDEHQLILKVLDGLEGFAAYLENNKPVQTDDLVRFAEFFREFADRCHHGKEEDILFEDMVQYGFSREFGPLAVMLQEHDLGREQVRIMRTAGETTKWTDEISTNVRNAAETFIDLLRNHIHKEDNILYPMAMQQIPQNIFEEMIDRFEEFEATKLGKDTRDRLHKLGEELNSKYA